MPAPYNTVVLPGIAGSSLSQSGGTGGKTRIWFAPTQILKYTPGCFALAADGSSPAPLIGRKLFPDGPVDVGIYEPLLTQLANDGQNPVFWAYDWRLNLLTTAAALASYLVSENLTNPFSLVCHSMGGIIAQMAYPLYLALKPTNTWANTIYLATPHGGAHWTPACLSGLYLDGSELYGLANTVLAVGYTNPVASSLLKATLTLLGLTVGSWPAAYCLLPNPYGIWNGLDENAAACLLLTTYTNTPGGQQQQWLTNSDTVLQSLVAQYAKPRPREVCFVGTGTNTPNRITNISAPGAMASYQNTTAGDGTVTAQRASLPNAAIVTCVGTTHNQMCQNYAVTKLIAQYITTPTEGDMEVDPAPPAWNLRVPPASILSLPPYNSQTFANKTADP